MDNEREDLPPIRPEEGLHVEPEDRLSSRSDNGLKTGHLIVAAILLVAVLVIWFYPDSDEEPAPAPSTIEEPVSEAPPPLPVAPDIPAPGPEPKRSPDPVSELDSTQEAPPPEPVLPPLTLEESDLPVRTELSAVGESTLLDDAMNNSDLLQRGAGIIDGLSRGVYLAKVLPIAAPSGKFSTVEHNGELIIDPDSFQRYNGHAEAFADMDTDKLASTFHNFRPLLEEAYASLGHKPDDMDNALIRSLDQILATPVIRDEIPVKKKEAVYVFVDPTLESLAPIQKQLLRMGPDNVARIKEQARALRTALLQE